ncbi:hypothetical protein HJG53_14415 [Sphingomonas sp. ID1715]|uniref:lysozyme inhibitor LprI family protein n=1 Tax=Sphingomonas sp. ID1715 TaxID=1656898 RepID=UPI001487ABE9|nr:hypothetical protein [Sphingomonas sp. ID1715]NNM78094.1 hypothetical protein [Sphingomonas sp. ID1715]
MRALSLILVAALATGGCKKLETNTVKDAKAESKAADERRVREACASQSSYERLKALAFEKAEEVRAGRTAMLDKLRAATVVRMEDPVVKSRDDALNVTVCRGRMIIDLPPGAEDAFNGERRLVADVEFAAQTAADGSGMVYQLDGAEPIIYRLAAIDMKGGAPMPTPSGTPETQVAEARPPSPPVIAPPPAPAPRPSARATPEQRPPQREIVEEERPRPALARPSFNCRNARTRTEQMVCGDERLAARDREMASQYYSAVAAADPETRAILRETRDRFLARRERCGGPGCVARAYEDRMDEIDRIMSE